MKKIPFIKMSGSGNDFLVIDNRRGIVKGNISTLAKKWCHRQFGVGADGLLLLERSREGSFRMRYYNSDGSRASMCGNGARCIAWVAKQAGIVGKQFEFLTDAGLVGAAISGNIVEVTLSDAQDYKPAFPVRAGGKTYHVSFINTGVPHAVVRVPDAEKVDVAAEGRALRYHSVFGPKGTNVNFVQPLGDHGLRVRTYERGVEGETLACGTGVAASAVVSTLSGWVTPAVRCKTTGGDTLDVRFDQPVMKNEAIKGIRLKGPVEQTFTGELYV